MADVLLRERITVLLRTLDAVERVIDDLEGSQAGGVTVPSAATDALTAMREQFEVLRANTEDVQFAPGTGPKVKAALEFLRASLEEFGSQLQAPASTSRLEVRLEGLVNSLNDAVKGRREQLKALIELVDRPQGLSAEDRVAAWDAYRAAEADCRRLFADYLDLVRGVALRDSGLDDGLCQIADALVRELGPFGGVLWDSLTVPASRERRDGPAAFIVRIGFPEWSVWTLPLTAVEFASFLITEHKRFIKLHGEVTLRLADSVEGAREELPGHPLSILVDPEALSDEEEQRSAQLRAALSPLTDLLLVEVLATTLMGPAYAWSALLMRVDPQPGQDVVELLRRDAAMATLRTLEKDLHDPAAAKARRDLLAAEWDALLATSGIQVVDRTDREGGLPHPLDRALADMLEMVVKSVLAVVSFRLEDDDWTLIEALADELRTGGSADHMVASITDSHGVPRLRHVLNAAWVLRLERRDDDRVSLIEPTDPPPLSRVVHDVCVAVLGWDAAPSGTRSPPAPGTVQSEVSS